MQAFVLAGGLGTRLRSVVADRPKPMALVNGEPFLVLLMRYWENRGVRRFFLLTGHLSKMIEDYFSGDPRVQIIREEKALGTGGAFCNGIRRAKGLKNRFLLLNGDSFSPLLLDDMENFHNRRQSGVTMAVTERIPGGRYGGVRTNEDFRILSFSEKEENETGLMNTGIYLIEKKVAEETIFSFGDHFSLEREWFPRLTHSDISFSAYRHECPFIDIGVPEDYVRASSFFRERQVCSFVEP